MDRRREGLRAWFGMHGTRHTGRPMTTVTAAGTDARPGRPVLVLASVATITTRNLRRLVRVTTLLVFATVRPVLFVVLFTYAFGGAIHAPGVAPAGMPHLRPLRTESDRCHSATLRLAVAIGVSGRLVPPKSLDRWYLVPLRWHPVP
jgi:hypothetical protein